MVIQYDRRSAVTNERTPVMAVEDEVRYTFQGTEAERTAAGGVKIVIQNEDEFGNDYFMTVILSREDIAEINRIAE